MSKSTVIHTRIDADLKAGAEHILDSIGISASEAIRLQQFSMRIISIRNSAAGHLNNAHV